jgi:hypothetical protein
MKLFHKIINLIGLSFLLLVIPSICFSDGIQVTKDLKNVPGEHTTIKLSQKQMEDVEQRRTVELTTEQLNYLRKIYEKIPKKLTVLSSRWDSCTCGMGIYAIWCRPGEIDIPYSAVEQQKRMDEPSYKKDAEEDYETNTRTGETIILDSQGQMFIEGKIITEKKMYAHIDGLSQKQTREKTIHQSVYLDIPPPINSEVDKAIKELVERLEKYSQNKGMNFWALGLSYEKMTRKIKKEPDKQ